MWVYSFCITQHWVDVKNDYVGWPFSKEAGYWEDYKEQERLDDQVVGNWINWSGNRSKVRDLPVSLLLTLILV